MASPTDYSTLNVKALSALPEWQSAPSITPSDSLGSACFMDPPGYPSYFIQSLSYFIQSLYNGRGDSPSRGPQAVIYHPETGYRVIEQSTDPYDARKPLLLSLWDPSTLSAERMEAWVQHVYQHMGNCWYFPHERSYGKGKDDTVCGTVAKPSSWTESFPLETFKDDPRFSDEWRQTEQARIAKRTEETLTAWHALTADLGNYKPVQYIRRWYPDHEARLDLIETKPSSAPHWYETLGERPTPENCPGEYRWGKLPYAGKLSGKHPVNGHWCQVCGWSAPKTEEVLQAV